MLLSTHFIIPTRQLVLQGRFLCELLELEVRERTSDLSGERERLYLAGDEIELCLEELPAQESERGGPETALVELQLAGEEELTALWKRYSFCLYRLEGEMGTSEQTWAHAVQGHESEAPLRYFTRAGKKIVAMEITDPSGRAWRFFTQKNLQ